MKITSCVLSFSFMLLSALPVSAASFHALNCSSSTLTVDAYNGKDSPESSPFSASSVKLYSGSYGKLTCNGEGKHRCKFQVSKNTEGGQSYGSGAKIDSKYYLYLFGINKYLKSADYFSCSDAESLL